MRRAKDVAADTLRAAGEDFADVVKLTQGLVRVPSRGGTDSYDPALETTAAWLSERGLACRQLTGPDGGVVALTCEVAGGHPGPRYVAEVTVSPAARPLAVSRGPGGARRSAH
jgi:succinyl-diaminopimelate desuccinylase